MRIKTFISSIAIFLTSFCFAIASDLHLEVHCTSCNGEEVTIKMYNVINGQYDVVSSNRVSQSGSTKIILKDFRPGKAFLSIGEANRFQFFLESGQMTISIDSTAISFNGDRKVINEYSNLSDKIYRSNAIINGQFILSIRDSLEQVKYLGILSDKYKELNETIKEDDQLDLVEKEFMLTHTEFLVEQLRTIMANQYAQIPEYNGNIDQLLPLLDKIPIRPVGLKYNDEGYTQSLKWMLMRNLYDPINYYLYNHKIAEKDSLGVIVSNFINGQPKLQPIREFLLAFNIFYVVTNFSSVTPTITTLYQQFKREFPQSIYVNDIESVIKNYLEVSEGAPAKDIKAFYEDGRPFSINDFKGKVLYIDTWATWCKPCIAEFPHSIALQKSYQDNPDVIFIFLSIDQDEQKWKSYLTKNPEFQKIGIQVRQPPTEGGTSIRQLYKMAGVPHYILIDKKGIIKQNNTFRPSQERQLRKLINSL